MEGRCQRKGGGCHSCAGSMLMADQGPKGQTSRSARAFGILLIGALTGCAGDYGTCRAPVGDLSVTPSRVAADERLIGQWVTWGGLLVSVKHLPSTTELDVLAYPLNHCGRPLVDRPSRGRFVLVYPGYLETGALASGRLITATGELTGVRDDRVGEAPVRLPLLQDPAPRVWPEQRSESFAPRPVIGVGVGIGTGWRGGGFGLYW